MATFFLVFKIHWDYLCEFVYVFNDYYFIIIINNPKIILFN